jgi:transcriptional regulator with XRE-family HTH domain
VTDLDDDRYVGQQIRAYRRVRGYTQQQLADFLGVSRPAITQYETGLRPVDRRDLLYRLAEVLQVSIGDLTGHSEDKFSPAAAAFHAQVPRIEAALMAAGRGEEATKPRPVGQLAADAEQALSLRAAADYSALGRLLPSLISDRYRWTLAGKERDQLRAWSGLTRATFATALATKGLGHTALAWMAANAASQAAEMTGTAVDTAAAAYARSQVMLATPGAVIASLANTADGISRVQPQLDSAADRELYGQLHLSAALSSAVLGKDPSAHLAEAGELAQHAGDGSAYRMSFGPQNVGLWRMSVALERRRGGEAVGLSRTFDPSSIESAERRSRYFVELGRAHALEKDYRSSLHALLRGEHEAPQQVRSMTVVRELVGHMLRAARRDLVTGDLGKLARRVGAVPV